MKTVKIPKKYSHEYVSCLPLELEQAILNCVSESYSYLDNDSYSNMIENVKCEKVTNITDTINIEFVHEI